MLAFFAALGDIRLLFPLVGWLVLGSRAEGTCLLLSASSCNILYTCTIMSERGRSYAFLYSHSCVVAGFSSSLASKKLVEGGGEPNGKPRPCDVLLVLCKEAPDLADLVERMQSSTEAGVSLNVYSTSVPSERGSAGRTERKKVDLEVKKEQSTQVGGDPNEPIVISDGEDAAQDGLVRERKKKKKRVLMSDSKGEKAVTDRARKEGKTERDGSLKIGNAFPSELRSVPFEQQLYRSEEDREELSRWSEFDCEVELARRHEEIVRKNQREVLLGGGRGDKEASPSWWRRLLERRVGAFSEDEGEKGGNYLFGKDNEGSKNGGSREYTMRVQ